MPTFQDSSEKIFHHVDEVYSPEGCYRENCQKYRLLEIKSDPDITRLHAWEGKLTENQII